METVVIGRKKLTIEEVVAIAKRKVAVELESTAEFQKKIDAGAEFLDEALAEHGGDVGAADAALAASIFHLGEIRIPDLKRELKKLNIPVRI